jgi:hypothetical protein
LVVVPRSACRGRRVGGAGYRVDFIPQSGTLDLASVLYKRFTKIKGEKNSKRSLVVVPRSACRGEEGMYLEGGWAGYREPLLEQYLEFRPSLSLSARKRHGSAPQRELYINYTYFARHKCEISVRCSKLRELGDGRIGFSLFL